MAIPPTLEWIILLNFYCSQYSRLMRLCSRLLLVMCDLPWQASHSWSAIPEWMRWRCISPSLRGPSIASWTKGISRRPGSGVASGCRRRRFGGMRKRWRKRSRFETFPSHVYYLAQRLLFSTLYRSDTWYYCAQPIGKLRVVQMNVKCDPVKLEHFFSLTFNFLRKYLQKTVDTLGCCVLCVLRTHNTQHP